MGKKICLLYVKDKDDDMMHNFLLTPEEVLSLANMPVKSADSEEPSHLHLYGANLDAYRLGEEFHVRYKSEDDVYIYPEDGYSVIGSKLKDVLNDFNINNKSRVIVYL